MASAYPGPQPHFVQVVKVEKGKLTLDEHRFRNLVTQQKIGSRSLSVVCLSGEFGRGKRYLNKIFVSYLKNEGYRNHDWTKFQKVIANQKNKAPDEQGIYVWSEVFIVNEIALLLMQTQSDYMYEGRRDIPVQLFALSTLLSSVQVVNLRSQIRGVDLEFLVSFTQLAAKCAVRLKETRPFRKLQFVVRDWQYQCDNDYGMKGGEEFLSDVLKNCKLDTGYESVEKFLASHFVRKKCFLMPHPAMEGDFNSQLTPLCGSLFHPMNLDLKIIRGDYSVVGLAKNSIKLLREEQEESQSGKRVSEKISRPVSETIKFFQKGGKNIADGMRKLSTNSEEIPVKEKPKHSSPLLSPSSRPPVPPRPYTKVPKSPVPVDVPGLGNVIGGELRNRNTDESLFDIRDTEKSEDFVPAAVRIVKVHEGKLRLDRDALWEILKNPSIGDKPLSIVAMAGAFRKGKSFILNFFLRYLRNKGYERKDDDTWMGDLDRPLDDGFKWRGGKQPDTQGILMWNESFSVKTNKGEVAVLLVDTQGLFDTTTSKDIETKIFAFSTLLSSVQILNLVQQIQENDLDFLQYTTEYAAAAEEQRRERRPFQALKFLVRDWPHLCDHKYGWDGGHEYLNGLMDRPNKQHDLKSVRDHLRTNFDTIQCFLMPSPGNVIIQPDFDGRLRHLDENFRNCLTPLLQSVMHKNNLVLKRINGDEVKAKDLFNFSSHIFEIFESGYLPTAQTYMEVSADLRNSEARRECLESYTYQMEEKTKSECLTISELKGIHNKVKIDVMALLKRKTGFGGLAKQGQIMELVESEIDARLNRFVAATQANKATKDLQKSDLHAQAVAKYKAVMKQVTKSPLPPAEFSKIHQQHFAASKQICDNIDDALNMEYEKLKQENQQRYEIVKQKREGESIAKKLEEARNTYDSLMTQVCCVYINPKKLKREHVRIKQDVIREFESTISVENIAHITERLESELEQKCNTFENENAITEAQHRNAFDVQVKNLKGEFSQEIMKFEATSVYDSTALSDDLFKIRQATLRKFEDHISKECSEIATPFLDMLITFCDEKIQIIQNRNSDQIEANREAKAKEEMKQIEQNCLMVYETNMRTRTQTHLFSEEELNSEHNKELKLIVADLRKNATRLGIPINSANDFDLLFQDKFNEISSYNQKRLRKAKQSLQQKKQYLVHQYKKMMSDATEKGNVDKRELEQIHREHREFLLQKIECEYTFQSDYISDVICDTEKEINEIFKEFETSNNKQLEAATMEKTAEAELQKAIMESVSHYQRYILEISEKYAPPDQLAEVHRYGKKETLSRFDFATKTIATGKPGEYLEFRNKLEDEVQLEFQRLKVSNESMKKTILEEISSLVEELVEEYHTWMERKTAQEEMEEEDLKKFHDNVFNAIKLEFDQRLTYPELACDLRDDLWDAIDKKFIFFLSENRNKCAERRKKQIQRTLLELFSGCFNQYQNTMSKLTKEYVNQLQLSAINREAKDRALDRYRSETRKYRSELDDLDALLPLERTLEEKIVAEYEEFEKLNGKKKEEREYAILLEMKRLISLYEEKERQELKLSEVFENSALVNLHRRLVEEARKELLKEEDSDLSKRFVKQLERDLKETYRKSEEENSAKMLAIKKFKMEEELLEVVSSCADDFDKQAEKFSGVFVNQARIVDKLGSWKNKGLSLFDEKSRRICSDNEAIRRHRKNLDLRLRKALKAAISENGRNKEHYDLTKTKMQKQSVLMYHVIMDYVLLPGYITEKNLRKLHDLVIIEVFEHLDAEELPMYMEKPGDKSETPEFKELKIDVKRELDIVYSDKSKMNKKNHGFFVKAMVAAKENLCNVINRIGDANLGQFHTRKHRVSTSTLRQDIKKALESNGDEEESHDQAQES